MPLVPQHEWRALPSFNPCPQDARKRVKDCAVPAETDLRWKQIFAEELDVIAEKMSQYEMERQVNILRCKAGTCLQALAKHL